ncbi:MAG: hypothetical protein ACLF0G_08790 [Candidatus Brocadiia bacterium]
MEKIAYLDLPNCQRLSNGTVEVVVATDIGPRILRYAFTGQDNILGECPQTAVQTDLGEWKPWGGHRLWHAPEAIPRSYVPDNAPVELHPEGDNAVRLRQPVEEPTGIQKEITVALDAQGTRLVVRHRLTNQGLWRVSLAPWALTIMNGGGAVVLPQEPYRSHDDYLLPARPMVLWHYTDLTDPRFALGSKLLQLRTDARLEEPQKIGIANKQGWAAYLRDATLFVKRFPYQPAASYPDYGCNCETYTAGDFVELETLGPMTSLEQGESVEYTERWYLFQDVEGGENEEALAATIAELLQKAP